MIGYPPDEYFKRLYREHQKDPRYIAEDALIELTEQICLAHGQPKGIYKHLFHLMAWCADKLIWRREP